MVSRAAEEAFFCCRCDKLLKDGDFLPAADLGVVIVVVVVVVFN